MGDPAAAVAQLKAACDRAYDNNLHSCSNAVYDLIKELVNPGETYRQANEFIDYWGRKLEEREPGRRFRAGKPGYRGRGWLKGPRRARACHRHLPRHQDPERWISVLLQTSQQVSDLEADGDVSAWPIHFDQHDMAWHDE